MSAARPKLLFVVTEDWFFCSHFLPMARAALADGFDVAVACRVRDHGEIITALGCRLLPLEADRKTLNPLAVLKTISAMRRLIAAENPDIVHLIALRSIVIGGLAARLEGVSRRVVALTGMGLLGAAATLRAKLARLGIRAFISQIVDGDDTRFLFENRSDPALLGLDPDDRAKVTIVGGAGIDPEVFRPEPLPDQPPLKLAMIARMLWSKGADTAVAAVLKARAAGAALRRAGPRQSQGHPRSHLAGVGCAARHPLAWPHCAKRGTGGLGGASRCRSAIAGRGGATAHLAGSSRLRPRYPDHGCAGLP
jgi:hypothetical protein